MSIVIKEKTVKAAAFAPMSLVKSTSENGNIYLVIGPGRDEELFAGVRIGGKGAFGYQDDILRRLCVPFEGEVVISNE
jgi:hypothetical protein